MEGRQPVETRLLQFGFQISRTKGLSSDVRGRLWMRAFRPSRFATEEDLDEDGARIKQENLVLYEALAALGKPLFEWADDAECEEIQQKLASQRR